MGYLEGSHNIFLGDIETSLSEIPKDKPLLLVDEFGNESPQAAAVLVRQGYKNVSTLFNGIDEWIDEEIDNGNNSVIQRIHKTSYAILSDEEFNKMTANGKCHIIDVRNKEQFTNQSKNYWENIGQIKGAINIPAAEIEKSNLFPAEKSTPLILY
jgi:rhodanese-related sulfurtransferase